MVFTWYIKVQVRLPHMGGVLQQLPGIKAKPLVFYIEVGTKRKGKKKLVRIGGRILVPLSSVT